MDPLGDELTCLDCYSCREYKPTTYTFALNYSITNDLECLFYSIVALLLILIYYTATRQIKLFDQLSYQLYYLFIMLIYVCETVYLILSWILHYYSDKLYFDQLVNFYLVEQGDILMNSFFLSVTSEKFQDLDEFLYKRLIVWIIKLSNFLLTSIQSIWLLIIVSYFHLCKQQIDNYQIFQLISTILLSLTTITVLWLYLRQRKEQVLDQKSLRPLYMFIILLLFGSSLQIFTLIFRYQAAGWLLQFKYDMQLSEIQGRFNYVVDFKLENTTQYALYDLFIYIFTTCLPLILFVYMYSQLKETQLFQSIKSFITQ
ncbi:hypothetical protein pb186bvf_011828 [Paramecium bursaria]